MPNLHRAQDSGRAHPSAIALVALALTVAVATGAPTPARAQGTGAAAETDVADFRIAAGPLAPALRQFASTADIMLTFTSEQTEGKRTAGLNGQYPATGALARLLAGTGLQAV